MSVGVDPLDFGPGERTITRPPRFFGGEFVVREVFDTFAEANEYVDAVQYGYADAFISDAWHTILVRRNRDARGRFIRPPWVVQVVCRRPRPGELSSSGDPSDPSQVMELA